MEDFHALLHEKVVPARMDFGWHDPERDPSGKYIVDCRINGMQEPLLVYGLANDNKTRDATIALRCFKDWGMQFNSVGIIKDEKAIGHRVLERFRDVCECNFTDIRKNREVIGKYLDKNISTNALLP